MVLINSKVAKTMLSKLETQGGPAFKKLLILFGGFQAKNIGQASQSGNLLKHITWIAKLPIRRYAP